MKRPPSRDCVNQDRSSKKSRQPIRLVLEPLEARRLLAGLNVSVFIDQDGSRSLGDSESAAARRIVYVDVNANGRQDDADPVAFTNERGVASFLGLAPGEYGVGIVAASNTQTQTFPVRVEELATNVAPSATTLIATGDLANVWAFDEAGRGQAVKDGVASAAPTSTVRSVDLQGAILASITIDDEAWLVTAARGSGQVALNRLDLVTGRNVTSPIDNLNGRSIEKLVVAGTQVVAQLNGRQGIELAVLTLNNGMPTLGDSVSVPFLVALAGSADGELAVIQNQPSIERSLSDTASLTILAADDFAVRSLVAVPADAKEVAFSYDGELVLTALATGGVLALKNDEGLSVVAKLAEAASPLLTTSKDGRLVTGNASDRSEFIVWDMEHWQPAGRSRIAVGDDSRASAVDLVLDAVLATSGDRLIATGVGGTFVSQLAQATWTRTVVPREGTGSAQLGVRADRANQPPNAAPVASVTLEDTAVGGQLRAQTTDVDGDTLWFSLLSAPSHGRLEVTPSGKWSYVPASNFNGIDRAVVRVFDGQASSDLAIVVDVTPVNDPPEEIQVELFTVAENADPSELSEIGYVTVFDVDRGSRYSFEASDPRFEIRSGRIYLAAGAELDFESEKQIELEIFATEDAVSGYQISTTATLSITDVNEPPTAVRIVDAYLPENSAGAVIGRVVVDDPEGATNFEYTVSDERFMISAGYLMLKPGIELDYEEESSISLSVTASDGSESAATEFPLSFTVADVNDPPTAISVQLTTIEENSPGAIFGAVTVVDQDGDAYQYTVSDPRFEVVDGQLKLKDEVSLSIADDDALSVTVTATSATGGDSISNAFTIAVGVARSPFQNPVEPRDVNGDGQITPVDALILINQLNSFGPGPLGGNSARGGSGEGPMWVDVNGDGIISPLDVLIIINWLNRRRLVAVSETQVEGEAPPTLTAQDPFKSPSQAGPQNPLVGPVYAADSSSDTLAEASTAWDEGTIYACPPVHSTNETKPDSQDDELEQLLEQLSQQRLRIV